MHAAFDSQHLPAPLYKTIIESASDVILIIDADLLIQYGSPSVTRSLGYQPSEYLGKSVLEFIHPDDQARCVAALQRTRAGDQDPPVEQRVRHRNGEWRYFQSSADSCNDGSGGFFFSIISRDQTEERRTGDELRKLSQAIAQSPVIVIITDADGRIEFVNPKFCQVTGYTAQEVIGKNPRLLKSGRIPPEVYRQMWASLKSGREWRGEFYNRRKSGEEYWASAALSPIRDAAGNITHLLSVQEDITEQKKMQENIQRTQRLENIGVLAAGIAHELNNVLSPVMMASDLLLEDDLPDGVRGPLEIIHSNARRGADIVKQVLSFGRGSATGFTRIDPQQVTHDLIGIIERTFPKNIRIRLETLGTPEKIHASPTLLLQALLNLCINARDAMPNGGELTVQCESRILDENYSATLGQGRPGCYVGFTVADTGVGMSEETLNKIFVPFFTTKAVGKGTGLGLSTVLGIVQSHQGFMEIKSRLGLGSSFKLFVPTAASAADGPAAAVEAIPKLGRGQLVLIVDDEPDICEANRAALERYNYRAMVAANGAEAVAAFAKRGAEIAVVLMDFKMPVMDGPAAICAIRKLNPEAKIIACTGSLTPYRGDLLRAEGRADAFLPKPYDTEQLMEVLRAVLVDSNESPPGATGG